MHIFPCIFFLGGSTGISYTFKDVPIFGFRKEKVVLDNLDRRTNRNKVCLLKWFMVYSEKNFNLWLHMTLIWQDDIFRSFMFYSLFLYWHRGREKLCIDKKASFSMLFWRHRFREKLLPKSKIFKLKVMLLNTRSNF